MPDTDRVADVITIGECLTTGGHTLDADRNYCVRCPYTRVPLWDEVTQTILHDPENKDVYGNCLQAAVASILRKPLDAVPHFSQFTWWPQALTLWARGHELAVRGERTTEIPHRLAIVGGTSPRQVAHVVIGYRGEVVWDPHPSRDGLVSVKDATWFEPITDDDYRCLWRDEPCWGWHPPEREAS